MTWYRTTDQMGTLVELQNLPRRIISLVPSQTELLADLGLEEEVAGITKFCVHPEHWRSAKTIIGGTKNFDFRAIQALRPDLIIGNKEENYPEGIARLRTMAPVWMSDISTFDDAIRMIESVAGLTGRELSGKEMVKDIQTAFRYLKAVQARALYLMWREPWMGAAGKTFIHALMNKAGLVNVLDQFERYPELTVDVMQALQPEVVLLSTEPYPFSHKHVFEIQAILPGALVMLVDGEMFSWYGSRLRMVPAYLNSLKIDAEK